MNPASKNYRVRSVIALSLLALSCMLVEVALTKFVAYKVYYHCVYAIISTAILSSGLAGITVSLFPWLFFKKDGGTTNSLSIAAFLYAVLLPLAVIFFAWCPLDPYTQSLSVQLKLFVLPLYFFVFGIPFFFCGLAISGILVTSDVAVRRLLFFDLLAAALGAALCPASLEFAGGYGTVCISAVLAMIASVLLWTGKDQTGKNNLKISRAAQILAFFVSVVMTLSYQPWAVAKYGFDIRTTREDSLKKLVLNDFHGIDKTYWNVISRIDVSNTGHSSDQYFTYAFAERMRKSMPAGRMVLVDGSAPTRQFEVRGPIKEQKFVPTCLWAIPYLIRQAADPVLVIAGGGGSDILVAKSYGIKNIDVIEINPSTFKNVLQGGKPEERRYYQDAIVSDENTKVNLFNTEGRHFSTTRPDGHYEVVQASAADTCTAISTGALAMVENQLYSLDAVHDFMRILKPDGLLSLSHFRSDPPTTHLRMFATYLEYLDNNNVKDPQKYVLAVGDGQWCDVVMKRSPFTQEEMSRVRQWVKDTDKALVYDPLQAGGFNRRASEDFFDTLALAPNAQERKKIRESYHFEITPVTDDKPFFYLGTNWVKNDSLFMLMYIGTLLFSSILIFVPLLRKELTLGKNLLPSAIFFVLCGFSFLLFELAIMQKLTVFVGGPINSMSIVLASVLLGYAGGSLIAGKLRLSSGTFIIFCLSVPLCMLACYSLLPVIIKMAMPLALPVRVALSMAITVVISILVGMPVPCAMDALKKTHSQAIGWFWGLNCAFNSIGAMSFGMITSQLGCRMMFLIAGAIYMVALTMFVVFGPLKSSDSLD